LESIFQPREEQFNNIISSNNFNEMNSELATDITNLFQNLATNDQKLTDILETLQVNNQQLTNRISFLETQINNLDVDKEYIDFYRSNMISYAEDIDHPKIPENERAYINSDYNVATLNPVYQDSKSFLYNETEDEIFLPEDLSIDITPETPADDNAEMFENNYKNGFDQDIATQWKRKVIYPSSSNVTNTSAKININLPNSIINNNYVNTIYINPYPDACIDIVSVKYKLENNSDFQSLADEGVFENANARLGAAAPRL
jgi:hypothetical protein